MRLGTIILTMSLMLIGSASFAGNGETAFRKKINKLIHYPLNISKKVEAIVYVEFTVLENKEIRIDDILCENEEIKASIEKQLKNIKIDDKNTEIINKKFYYKFNLKVEE